MPLISSNLQKSLKPTDSLIVLICTGIYLYMKRSFILILLVFIAASSYSQIGIGIGSGGMGVGMRFPIHSKKQQAQNIENKVQHMRTDLNLDSSQVIKVRGLLVERDRRQSKGQSMSREEFNN